MKKKPSNQATSEEVTQMPQAMSSKSRSPKRSPAPASPTLQPSTPTVPAEAVAKRAYEKFLARGCTHGHDQDDWLAAEQELIAEALWRNFVVKETRSDDRE